MTITQAANNDYDISRQVNR